MAPGARFIPMRPDFTDPRSSILFIASVIDLLEMTQLNPGIVSAESILCDTIWSTRPNARWAASPVSGQ